MGSPTSVLGNARAFARDFPRDNMPAGYLWDVVDFVPQIIDTNLNGRGKWSWGSVATGFGDVQSGILAPFTSGEQVLVQTSGNHLLRLNLNEADQTASTWSDLGASFAAVQNPVQLFDTVVHCDAAGARVPQLWRGAAPLDAYSGMGRPKVATVWQGVLISGGGQGPSGADEGDVVRYSLTGGDLAATSGFDTNAFDHTSGRVTALQAMRSMVLIFHAGSVERLRGGPFPNTAAAEPGGIIIDGLFDRIGCTNPRSVAIWNDQCIWANEKGVHITDGSAVRDLTSQGSISYYWRLLYEGAISVCGTTFLDYYIITVRHAADNPPIVLSEGSGEQSAPTLNGQTGLLATPTSMPVPLPPDQLPDVQPPLPDQGPDGTYNTTLVCDLNRKQWFRFGNFGATVYFSSSGSLGMERIWGGFPGTARLVRIAPCFYPNVNVEQVDDNGYVVKPRFETPWYRLGEEGRKRIRFGYLSFDARAQAPVTLPLRISYATTPQSGGTYKGVAFFPITAEYSRLRFPINRSPYGIMFMVEAIDRTKTVRIFDLAVEAQAKERSRV